MQRALTPAGSNAIVRPGLFKGPAHVEMDTKMSIGTKIYTWLHGELVGTDSLGNRYYKHKRTMKRRWVLYHGVAEASKVPPEWHAWLHHTTDMLPGERKARSWEKEHIPNLTGTAQAYRPQGALEKGGRHAPATGDYEPWRP